MVTTAGKPSGIAATAKEMESSSISKRFRPCNMATTNMAAQTPHPTPYLHGAAMIIKREVIEKIGMMPEIFFLYYEELDWSTSMTRTGYELWYEPRCTVFHKESQSTGQLSKLRTYFLTRNRLLYARRNMKGMERLMSVLYQSTIAAGKNSLSFAFKGRFDLFCATYYGVCTGLFMSSSDTNNSTLKKL